jgi:hypothetical protein
MPSCKKLNTNKYGKTYQNEMPFSTLNKAVNLRRRLKEMMQIKNIGKFTKTLIVFCKRK